jgi:putative addiction module component (TIGR02574 family)
MIALAEIQQLPLREKLMMMEALWDSIATDEEQLDVPQWHKDVLDEREKLVQDGRAKFIDWEAAKPQVRDATARGFKSLISRRTI